MLLHQQGIMCVEVIYLIIFVSSRMFCVGKMYANYTLYQAVPIKEKHINFFLKLKDQYDVVFWREPSLLYYPIEFVISPQDRQNFMDDAKKHDIQYTKVIEDVQSAFDQQTTTAYSRTRTTQMDWDDYRRLDDIYSWLQNLSKTYPEEIQLQSIGETYEYRQILALRVLLKGSHNRSTVMIEGGIHGREWISTTFVTFLINAIVNSKDSRDKTLKEVAKTYEWYFVPVLNPDGYEYTYNSDRLWRKNRNGDDGVDLNRNFAFDHGTTGVSWKSNSDIYCGRKPFSEKESYAMAKLVESKGSTLEYYITFHSYGQHIVISYGNTKMHLDNYDEVFDMCKRAANKIKARYKTFYDYGNVYETVGYLASGASSCWVKSTFHVPYVVSFELRDSGYEGFTLNRKKILPTCKETLDGVISFLVPQTINFTKLTRTMHSSGRRYIMSDPILIVISVLLFIREFCLNY